MPRLLLRLIRAAALLLSLPASAACPPHLQVVTPSGERFCLTDYPVSEKMPLGYRLPLWQVVPRHGLYHVALPRDPGQCPYSLSFSSAHTMAPGNSGPGTSSEVRAVVPLKRCQAAAGEFSKGSPCECVVAIADGHAVAPQADFERMARAASQKAIVAEGNAKIRDPEAQQQASLGSLGSLGGPQVGAAQPAPSASAVVVTPPSSPDPMLNRVALQTAPEKLRTRALVIGNGAYQDLSRLPNPRRDAEAVAAKFRAFGFDVMLTVDANRQSLVRSLADFQRGADGYDLNILYYAGHGIQLDGVNYLVPIDVQAGGATAGSVKLTAVSLYDALEYLPSATRLVFLDACRDNPIARRVMLTRSTGPIGLAPINVQSGTLVSYATKDGATAEDGKGEHSPFTAALLQHLDADDDIAVILRRVRQSVLAATNRRQEPWEYGSLVGEKLVLSRISR